jgi:hypothetical protein
MKILITLPDCNYYLWQMLVQINNFKKFGLDSDVTYLIGKSSIQKSSVLNNIILNSKTKCSFYVFNDERVNPKYSPSLRPYLLKKFFEAYPDKEKLTYFYTDPDVIFIKKPKLSDFEKDDVWYLSDTRSYLNSGYIKSKSEVLFKEMCEIVGIDPSIVEKNDDNAGGAQLIIKNTTSKFWEKVEKDCEALYVHMVKTSGKYCPEFPIQSWTAEMWATIWNAWYFEHKTKIVKQLDFSWATDEIKKWKTTTIYHNAGAVIDNGVYFLKTKYQISPFKQELKTSGDYCSHNYVKEIKETENNFQHLLF